jgi:citrate lyase subunit beta / citryl-CoA lyase
MSELVRRTSLFVPVNKRDFVERAWTRGADAIILDLEDSIPEAEKPSARGLIRESIPIVARGGANVIVRINKQYMEEDVRASAWPGLSCIMLPKAELASEVEALDRLLTAMEEERGLPAGSTQIALLIESALGVWNAYEVLHASKRIATVSAGGLDMLLDLGQEHDSRIDTTSYIRQRTLIVARLAGVQAQGMVPNPGRQSGDAVDGRFESAVLARKAGFRGTNLTHPAGIDSVNRGFTPQPVDLEWAERVLAAYEEGLKEGIGAVGLDGQMIDLPVVVRAERLIARAHEIEAFEARKKAAVAAST